MRNGYSYQREYQIKQFMYQLYVYQQNMEINNKFLKITEVYNIIDIWQETFKIFSTVLFDF